MSRVYALVCFALLAVGSAGCQCPSCALPKWMSPSGCTTCSAHNSAPIPPPVGH